MRVALDSGERHFLKITAVGISGFQSDRPKLIGDIFDRELFAFGSRRTPFKFVGRKNFDVGEQSVGRDDIERRLEFFFRFIGSEKGERSAQSNGAENPGRFHVYFFEDVVAAFVSNAELKKQALAAASASTTIALPGTGRQALSFFLRPSRRSFSRTARPTVCDREIFRSTSSRRARRLARKSPGAVSFRLVCRDNHPSLFQTQSPCRRRLRRPRRNRSSRRRSRSCDQSKSQRSCSDRSAEKLFQESGLIWRHNPRRRFPDARRASRDRATRTRIGADKKRRPSLSWRHSSFG